MQTRPTTEPRGATMPASPPGRRNPASIVLAKPLSAIRGVKYMVDGYPPSHRHAAAVASRTKER